jgi:hypothetical protein
MKFVLETLRSVVYYCVATYGMKEVMGMIKTADNRNM